MSALKFGMTRRNVLGLVLTTSAAGLLAACTTPSSAPTAAPTGAAAAKPTTAPAAGGATTTTASPAASTAPAAQVKRGGVLRRGMVGDITTTDAASWSPQHNESLGQVAETLINLDLDLNPVPRLAESWDLSSDNKKIKLNLRKGVTFHSGREFTSDDVNYNLLRARDPKNPWVAQVITASNWWTQVEMPDKYTVILTSEQSRPGVFDFLEYLRIQDKDVRDGPDGNTKVGGTGPFKWVEWKSGQSLDFVKNEKYWETGYPIVDEYKVSIFRDQQSMMAALEAGTIDIAALAPVPDALRLRNDPKYTIYENHDLGQFFHASMSAIHAPTNNKLVRQAIGHAIDKKRFADQIMRGLVGEPRALPWYVKSAAFDAEKNKAYGFDLDKARSLLAQAGVTNLEFDISWATAGFSAEYAQLAQIIQSDLAKIGVKTNLRPLDGAAFSAEGAGREPTFKGMRLSAGAFAAQREAASEFGLSRTWGYVSNASGFYDPAYEALCIQASTEPDEAKRKELYGKLNDYNLDQAYVHVLSPYTNLHALRANVKDFGYDIATTVELRKVWLA